MTWADFDPYRVVDRTASRATAAALRGGCRLNPLLSGPFWTIQAWLRTSSLNLEPFYAAYRSDGHGAAAHEPKMMLTPARLLLRRRRALLARDRAPLPRGRRLPGDLRQPDPRPRDDRPLPGPPPGGARRSLRPGARPLRRRGTGRGGGAGGRRDQARGLGVKPRHPKLRADRRRDPRRGRSRRRRRGRALRRGPRR